MPSYKVTYFDIKGLGDPIRMILSYMGKEFEDDRISMEKWPTTKPTIKWGKLPVLDVDGKRMYQAQAIMRYLAKQAKLAGETDWEAYEIDSVVGTITDLIQLYIPMWSMTDEKAKEELKNKLLNEHIPYYMKQWNEIASNNGFLANGKLSWADMFFHGWVETLEALMNTEFVNQYPNLKLGREKLYATPGVKDWIAKRPKTI